MKKLTAFFTLLLMGAFGFCNAQTAFRMDSLLNLYSQQYPLERIYIQTDKPSYIPGDTIWYKGYLLNGIEPSIYSKTVYVDISDANGKVLAHEVHPVGLNFGQFAIPDSIATSSIHMRAYTKWMLNEDSTFNFNKDIKIILPSSRMGKGKTPVLKPQFTFFPEGGWLVDGLMNKLAFKANDQFGRPIEVKGTIKKKNGESVNFSSKHDGMGFVPFVPDINEQYSASWSDDKGHNYTASLPAILKDGVNLSVGNTGSSIVFNVTRRENASENFKSLNIVAVMYKQLVFMARINLTQKNSITGQIPTDGLPAGIIQLTIADQNWKPLAERVAFVGNLSTNTITPEVGFTKLSFNRKSENTLAINVTDSTVANMSLAVVDNSIPVDSLDNIFSYFFMSSELKGKVYHPTYYMNQENPEAKSDLDLVMLTHGWRRYNWDLLSHGQLPPVKYTADTSLLMLSGKVFGAKPDQLRRAQNIVLLARPKDTSDVQSKIMKSYILSLRPDGSFVDSNTIFFDSLSVAYQFVNKQSLADRVTVNFMPDRMPSPKSVTSIFSPTDFNFLDTAGDAGRRLWADRYEAAVARRKANELKAVTVTAKLRTPLEKMDDKYASGMFKSDNGYAFDIVNDMIAQSSINVFQYLQGRVAGLNISNAMGDNPQLTWRGGTPGLFLDEVPQSDASMISNLPMSDVAYIKVFRPIFMGGMNGANGAIAIYTRRGDDVSRNNAGGGLPMQTIAGYSYAKDFYSPNYANIDADLSIPDMRTTLFWSPLIVTNPQNPNVKISFFNNDNTKSFRVILEGLDTYGRLIHVEKVVE